MSTSLKEGAPTPEKWKRPEEVMRLHKLRMKKKALQARMNRTEIPSTQTLPNKSIESITSVYEKRKNPFSLSNNAMCDDSLKRVKSSIDDEASSDQTLFRLFNMTESAVNQQDHLSFEHLFNKISSQTETIKPQLVLKNSGSKVPPIDWTLRTKVRFMAHKPFAWNENLRTCEEASGITGFVRCLDTQPSDKSSLDTSPSARFHQCCLVWQHPALPWLELFPRTGRVQKVVDKMISPLAGHPAIRESLQRDWEESFRSLYQLLRARQCPYFYLQTHSFTCLFRAAGICGHVTTQAFITPTSRGFRQVLKDEDIAFTMPLKAGENGHKSIDDSICGTLDTTQNSPTVLDDVEEGEEAEEWLHSMGVEAAEIKRISATQDEVSMHKEKKLDKSPESLVYIEGTEVQVLFNFLLNCKSCISTTGPLMGIPPTLLAPVAFHGATLRPLKVRESKVRVNTINYYSMEVRGPILPTTVHNLCNLLSTSQDQFSFTFANLDSTKPFTLAGHATVCGPTMEEKEASEMTGSESNASCSENKISNSAFEEENLSDCGLPRVVLKCLCSKDADSVQLFDSLKFSDSVYSWT